MGLLDGVIGGAIGATLTNVVGDFIDKQGGVGGLVQQFQQKGLGGMVSSWVGAGPNDAMTPDQVHHVFGAEQIQAMAQKIGIDPAQFADQIAQHLPGAVDKMTPGGTLPANS